MEDPNFQRVLKAYTKRSPFRPFTVELISGERIRVEHPEALVLHKGTALYLDPGGEWTFFDHEGVAQLTDLIDPRKPRARKTG